MDMKGSFKKASFRHGSYSAILTTVVLAILVVFNLFVRQLPADKIYFDISEQKMYSVGDKTKEFAANLKEDVTLYLIMTEGESDMTVEQLLKTYDSLSSHIHTEVLDSNKDFARLKEFGLDDTENVVDGSVIVASAKRFKYIPATDIYDLNQQAYQQQVELYDFDGEGEITSALSFVTSDDLPIMCIVNGHSEIELGSVITSLIDKANFSRVEINLLTDHIPEKCDVLVLNAPQKDYSTEEAEKIRDYVDQGGNLIIFSVYSANDYKNFNSVLEYVGVKAQSGVMFEGSGLYMQQPYAMVVPTNGTHSIMDSYDSSSLTLVLYGQGLLKSENARADITVGSLLTTSVNSFARQDLKISSVSKLKEDISGPFDVAVAVEDSANGMKAVVYSTPTIVTDSLLQAYPAAANADLFMDSLSWMCSFQQGISIPAKATYFPSNIYSTSANQISMTITVAIIPISILLVGFIVWYRRRTK